MHAPHGATSRSPPSTRPRSAITIILAILVTLTWMKMLSIAGVFQTTGPKLRVLSRMLVNLLEFSGLYLLFYGAVSVTLFVVMAGLQDVQFTRCVVGCAA
jgi:hypothetical protein